MNFSGCEQGFFSEQKLAEQKMEGAVTAYSNTPQKWHSKNVFIYIKNV